MLIRTDPPCDGFTQIESIVTCRRAVLPFSARPLNKHQKNARICQRDRHVVRHNNQVTTGSVKG